MSCLAILNLIHFVACQVFAAKKRQDGNSMLLLWYAYTYEEKLENYFLVNLVGGKTWRIKRYTVGLFASVNNLLNTKYRSGGFEDSRRVSYRQRLEEVNRPFGPLL